MLVKVGPAKYQLNFEITDFKEKRYPSSQVSVAIGMGGSIQG